MPQSKIPNDAVKIPKWRDSEEYFWFYWSMQMNKSMICSGHIWPVVESLQLPFCRRLSNSSKQACHPSCADQPVFQTLRPCSSKVKALGSTLRSQGIDHKFPNFFWFPGNFQCFSNFFIVSTKPKIMSNGSWAMFFKLLDSNNLLSISVQELRRHLNNMHTLKKKVILLFQFSSVTQSCPTLCS